VSSVCWAQGVFLLEARAGDSVVHGSAAWAGSILCPLGTECYLALVAPFGMAGGPFSSVPLRLPASSSLLARPASTLGLQCPAFT